MKKTLLLTIFATLAFVATSYADQFAISATIPAATKVGFFISDVAGTGSKPEDYTTHSGSALSFDTAGTGMEYKPALGIYLPTRYFMIDVSPVTAGGLAAPGNIGTVTATYSANVVPAGQTDGLNVKGTLTAVKVSGATGSQTETAIVAAQTLGTAVPTITGSQFSGGFLRFYVGVADGSVISGTTTPKVAGSKPFTNADKPGTYSGTLTITATLI